MMNEPNIHVMFLLMEKAFHAARKCNPNIVIECTEKEVRKAREALPSSDDVLIVSAVEPGMMGDVRWKLVTRQPVTKSLPNRAIDLS